MRQNQFLKNSLCPYLEKEKNWISLSIVSMQLQQKRMCPVILHLGSCHLQSNSGPSDIVFSYRFMG